MFFHLFIKHLLGAVNKTGLISEGELINMTRAWDKENF